MTKSEWIDRAAKNSGMTKKDLTAAYEALENVFECAVLAGEETKVSGVGAFEVREIPARTARNPKTNQSVEIPASRKLVFLPSKTMKEKLK